MKNTLKKHKLLIQHLVGISTILIYLFISHKFVGYKRSFGFFNQASITIVLWTGFSIIHSNLQKYLGWSKGIIKRLIFEITVVLLYSTLVSLLFYLINLYKGNIESNPLIFRESIIHTSIISISVISVIEAVELFNNWKETIITSNKLEKENIEAQFLTLKNQINPHFLFNSLNTLANYVQDNPKANFKVHKVDSLCSDNREGYVVEMQSLGNLTIRGYYFVPKTDGKHSVVMHLPGYSYGFEYLEGFRNRKGNTAEFALCVRGHGISKDVFDPWSEQTLWSVGACSKEENIYRSIYMDCVQAINFLNSRPEIDKSKIGVAGGSQGGGLAIATSALCNDKIAACAFFDPFLCDIKHQTDIRTMVKKEFVDFTKVNGNNCSIEQIFSVQEFNDTKNFAQKINCPVSFLASLFDDDCPVHCGFSAYNLIESEKSYKVYPNDSHLGESGQYDKLFNEVVELMKNK